MSEPSPAPADPLPPPSRSWERFESRFGRWFWPAVPVVATLIALRGAFSNSQIFYLRDLSFQYWPTHLWLRRELLDGTLPLWDPYTGFGQSALSDLVRQLFFPPTLIARVVLPPVIGFNLCVAMPFPVAAFGMYLFLRRAASRPASALGAAAFALSGPILSSGNFLNLSWSVAFVPWILLLTARLVDAPSVRRFSVLAVAFALQFLAGESVTLVAGAAIAVTFGAFATGTRPLSVRSVTSRAALVVSSGLVAGALAAFQVLPLAVATLKSSRVGERPAQFATMWALHPLTLVESLVPFAFGDSVGFGAVNAMQWHAALNSGREPFIFSIYLGVATLGLVLIALCAGGRGRAEWFWLAVACVALVCALGHYTPVYPALQRAIPPLQAFRYASKYIVFLPLALAPLAARGYDVIAAGGQKARRAARVSLVVLGALASIGALVTLVATVAPASGLDLSARLAEAVGVGRVVVASKVLVASMVLAGPTLFGVSIAAAWCIRVATVRPAPAPVILAILVALVAVDLLLAGKDLNPTANAALFGEAPWIARTREHPEARIYIGGRLMSAVDMSIPDPDRLIATKPAPVSDLPPLADRAQSSIFFATFPSAWRLRDSMSYDNAALWPREYAEVGRFLRIRSRDERARMLRRFGVGYFLVPWQGWQDGVVLDRFPDREPLWLYEGPPPTPRVSVVSGVEVHPDVGDALTRLADESYDPAESVLLEAGAEQAPLAPGTPVDWNAEIVSESSNEVVVSSTMGEHGGYLVLLDSFSQDWRVAVDGQEKQLLRANVLFRAVRLESGTQTVRFVYSPPTLGAGVLISVVTALLLLGLSIRHRIQARFLLTNWRVGRPES